jgi:hypothetical protein
MPRHVAPPRVIDSGFTRPIFLARAHDSIELIIVIPPIATRDPMHPRYNIAVNSRSTSYSFPTYRFRNASRTIAAELSNHTFCFFNSEDAVD